MDARSSILRTIALQGPVSRAEIARVLEVSGPTVTQVIKELLAQGIVREVDRIPSSGGRPATLIQLVSTAGLAMGVKLAPDHATGVHVDLAGKVVHRFTSPIHTNGVSAIEELITCIKKNTPRSSKPLLGIGVGVPGVVIPGSEGLTSSPLMQWEKEPLGTRISTALGVPVVIDNDVNTLAVAETFVVRTPEATDFLVLTLGRGIGLGLVAAGNVFRGSLGGSELGHITVDPQGPICECGKNGCLEVFISDPALERKARTMRIIKTNEGISDLQRAAERGDEKARDVFARAGQMLGQHVGNLINLFGPTLVLVSGEGSQRWHLWRETFAQAFDASVAPSFKGVRVELDPWDDDRWAQGAASLVLRAGLAPNQADHEQDSLIRERLITSRIS